MAFLRSSSGPDIPEVVRGKNVWLRAPSMGDYAAWAELRNRSRQHLTPWEPVWQRDDLSRGAFRRRVRYYQREAREGTGYSFLIFNEVENCLVGGLTLSNLRRGVTQAAVLGYWLGQPHTKRGYMTEAVRVISGFSFSDLHLHRLEAATMPANGASMRVLERNHFRREGFARQFLNISGRWEDHILYALLAEDLYRSDSAGRETVTA